MHQAMITVYGIRNCDTVKKARRWLDDHHLVYQFHDFKLMGLPEQRIDYWLAAAPWEKLLNRQGTTWRKLEGTTKELVTEARAARAVMLANPSLIKRPVVEWDNSSTPGLTIGFEPGLWSARLVGTR